MMASCSCLPSTLRPARLASSSFGPRKTVGKSGRRVSPISALAASPELGYLLASVGFTGLTNQWLAIRVALKRREVDIPYPQVYSSGKTEQDIVFNCYQRAHQNMHETLPIVLAAELLLAEAFNPALAAGLGAAWTVGRIVYALGYSSGDPAKRGPGAAISGLLYVGIVFTLIIKGGLMAFSL